MRKADVVTDPLLRTAHWTVTVADPPMPGALHHWVLTPHERVTNIIHLPTVALDSLWCLLHNLTAGQPGYTWATRAGDPQTTGGPVGVVDVAVGDPDAQETARYPMSGRADG